MRDRVLIGAMLTGFVTLVLLLASSIIAEASVTAGDRGDDVKVVQEVLAEYGYTIEVDGIFGPQTTKAVRHFQRANGLLPDAIVGPLTSRAMGFSQATRGQQTQLVPTPVLAGPCAQYAGLLSTYSPGWDIPHMQQIMHRESRCQPEARNPSGASGLLQIMPLHIPNLGLCGVTSASDLLNAEKNICSAAIVYQRAGGTSPWAQTR